MKKKIVLKCAGVLLIAVVMVLSTIVVTGNVDATTINDKNILMISYPTLLPPTPEKPTGPTDGYHGVEYCYSTEPLEAPFSVKYKFDWGDGSTSPWYHIPEACHTWNDVGWFYVRVKAQDENGYESSWSPALRVYMGNHPPKAYRPNGPDEGLTGEELTFTTHGFDKDGDDIWFKFDWDDGSTSNWLGPYHSYATCEASHSWDNYGNYFLKVYTKDRWNSDTSPLTELWIYWAPIIAEAGGPYKGYVDESVTLIGSATGGNREYTYEWDLDDDGEFDDATGKTVSTIWPNTGDYVIYLKVSDSRIEPHFDTDTTEVNIAINKPPNKPTITGPPTGETEVSYTYTAITTDPGEDQISYFFDWGDGTNSGWTDPIASGQTTTETKKWNEIGDYQVKVKARDVPSLEESEWSDPLSVSIPKNKAINTMPLFLRFLEQHPHIFPILQQLLKL